MEEKEKDRKNGRNEGPTEDVFKTEDIEIEEMAIDGICGVY
jgi:mycofactocin precursor